MSVEAQNTIKTISGQTLLISANGNWERINNDKDIGDQSQDPSAEGTALSAFEAPSTGKYPLTPEQHDMVTTVIVDLQEDEAQKCVDWRLLIRNKKLVELDKTRAKVEKNDDNYKIAKGKLKLLKIQIKASKKTYKQAAENIKIAQKLLDGKTKNTEKALNKILPSEMLSELAPISAPIDITTKFNPEPAKQKVQPQVPGVYPTTFKIEEPRHPRASFDCEIIFDGYDKIIDANKKVVKPEFLFGYTRPRLKSSFKNDDYLTCMASVSKVGRKYFLTLEIRIKSKTALRTYGSLLQNETIVLETVKGEKFYGKSINTDSGTIEAYSGHTIYKGIYNFSRGDINDLKNNYLDHIGILWTSGFEQYDIYNVDLLKNQIRCLKK